VEKTLGPQPRVRRRGASWAGRSPTTAGSGSQAAREDPGSHSGNGPGRSGELRGPLIVLGILVLTILVSLLVKKDKSLYLLGYIVAIVYVMRGPRRNSRPWSEVGIKPPRSFFQDLKKIWYLVLIVVFIFQFLAPEMGVAHLLGYYHLLVHYINVRVSQVPGLAGAALILSLFETIVYQVCVQERLSWFIGTPAAIALASVLAGFAHAASAGSGTFSVAFTDAAGVALDFAVYGIIWARTHNLAVTWATHYAADITGIIALTLIFR
jgi:membrane protease YdiL (CAAX protease family)